MYTINEKRVLDEFFELVKVPCSTLDEREIADILTAKLTELGGTVHEDNAGEILGGNAGNLIADFAGNADAPALMLTAHMDCVEPCHGIKPILENGVIRSDGTTILGSDDKAGVVAILEALRQLKEQNIPHGPLQVVFTIAEEGGVNGSRVLDSSLLHSDYGYTLDTHGHPGVISFKAPGKNQLHIRVQGKTAHAGVAPEKGINAIMEAAKLLAKAPQGRIDEETTCNFGKIMGGTANNIVPEFCDVHCETRSRDKAKLDAITDKIVKLFKESEAENGCKITVEIKKDYDPYTIDMENDGVKILKTAMVNMGVEPHFEESGGGSDANQFNSFGVPTVVLGVGMTDCHTVQETILEKDLYDSARLVLGIITEAVSK